MKKLTKATLDAEASRELKRLKKIKKAHITLQMEHDPLKKASNSVTASTTCTVSSAT